MHVLEVGEDTTSAVNRAQCSIPPILTISLSKQVFIHSVVTQLMSLSVCVCVYVCRIAEYIPPRPALPRKVGGAERAVANYHSQTATIANTLLEEYR